MPACGRRASAAASDAYAQFSDDPAPSFPASREAWRKINTACRAAAKNGMMHHETRFVSTKNVALTKNTKIDNPKKSG